MKMLGRLFVICISFISGVVTTFIFAYKLLEVIGHANPDLLIPFKDWIVETLDWMFFAHARHPRTVVKATYPKYTTYYRKEHSDDI